MSYTLTILHRCLSDIATLSGGGWQTALPLTNLQVPKQYYRVARSVSAAPAHTWFDIDLECVEDIRGMVVGPGNLTTAAIVTLTQFGDAARSIPVQSFVLPSMHPVQPWGDTPFGARYWFDGVVPWPNPLRKPNAIKIFDENVGSQYWRVEISDEQNPQGFIELGRLFMSGAWIPERNYEPESNSFGMMDQTLRSSTLAGGVVDRRRVNPRFFSFSLSHHDIANVFGPYFEMVDIAGFDQEVFVVQQPDDASFLQQRSFFARITEANPIVQAGMERGHMGLKLTEII